MDPCQLIQLLSRALLTYFVRPSRPGGDDTHGRNVHDASPDVCQCVDRDHQHASVHVVVSKLQRPRVVVSGAAPAVCWSCQPLSTGPRVGRASNRKGDDVQCSVRCGACVDRPPHRPHVSSAGSADSGKLAGGLAAQQQAPRHADHLQFLWEVSISPRAMKILDELTACVMRACKHICCALCCTCSRAPSNPPTHSLTHSPACKKLAAFTILHDFDTTLTKLFMCSLQWYMLCS
jgi:hypothetical protein